MIKGGFSNIDMSKISTDFTSNTAVTPNAEMQARILAAVNNRTKPIMICGLKAHASTTRYDQLEQPFIPAPFIKNTATSGHVKWTSNNVIQLTKNVTIVIEFDTTTATGVTTVKVTCSTAS